MKRSPRADHNDRHTKRQKKRRSASFSDGEPGPEEVKEESEPDVSMDRGGGTDSQSDSDQDRESEPRASETKEAEAPKVAAPIARVQFRPNPIQKAAIQSAFAGQNVFLSGFGGTGKTTLLQFLTLYFSQQGKRVSVLAGTATSRAQHGAISLDEYMSGSSLSRARRQYDVEQLRKKNHVVAHIKWTDVLLMDDISSLSAVMFANCDNMCKAARDNPAPFGGMQIIVAGSFYQLGPPSGTDFAFQSSSWSQTFSHEHCFVLQEDYRHLSSEIKRLDQATHEQEFKSVFEILKHHSVSSPRGAVICRGFAPLRITPLDARAERHNRSMYSALKSKTHRLIGTSTYACHPELLGKSDVTKRLRQAAESFRHSLPTPKIVRLRENTMIMLIANEGQHIAGDRGLVRGFHEERCDRPIVQFERTGAQQIITEHTWSYQTPDGTINWTQLPLIWGWSLSYRCLQGLCLAGAEIYLPRSHALPQQLSTIVSKLASLDHVVFWAAFPQSAQIPVCVREFYAQFQQK